MFRRVVAHEFGHIFSLTDDRTAVDCSSSAVTIMNREDTGSTVPPYNSCGINGPQTCDVNAVANIYSGWSTFTWDGGCDTSTFC